MAAPDLVRAKWVGAYEAQLEDKTILVPGETVVEIPRGEAEDSDNWKVLGAASKAKPEPPVSPEPLPPEPEDEKPAAAAVSEPEAEAA